MSIKKYDRFKVGESYQKTFQFSEQIVKDFANLVGDLNPLHIDSEYSSKSIFGKRVSHGALLIGFISSVLGMDFPGIGTILTGLDCKFIRPVFIDDEIKICLEISEKQSKKNSMTIEIGCINTDDAIVLSGNARVKLI